MSAVNEYSPEWHVDDDELVSRLRHLEWAPVPQELRQRCWDDFSRRVSRQAIRKEQTDHSRAASNLGERYDFRRFSPTRRMAVAHAAAGRYTPRTAFSVS